MLTKVNYTSDNSVILSSSQSPKLTEAQILHRYTHMILHTNFTKFQKRLRKGKQLLVHNSRK